MFIRVAKQNALPMTSHISYDVNKKWTKCRRGRSCQQRDPISL